MNSETSKDRAKKYRANLAKDSGLKKITVWVPDNEGAIASIKRSAKTLRTKHGKPLPSEKKKA